MVAKQNFRQKRFQRTAAFRPKADKRLGKKPAFLCHTTKVCHSGNLKIRTGYPIVAQIFSCCGTWFLRAANPPAPHCNVYLISCGVINAPTSPIHRHNSSTCRHFQCPPAFSGRPVFSAILSSATTHHRLPLCKMAIRARTNCFACDRFNGWTKELKSVAEKNIECIHSR